MYKSERHFALDKNMPQKRFYHQRPKPRLTLDRVAKAVWYGICIASTAFVIYALCDAASRVN